MNPYVIWELAQVREQEAMRAGMRRQALRELRRERRRDAVGAWLSRTFRGGPGPSRRPVRIRPELPPILHPDIRREAR
ncbi:MAG TPA: hypothetical protein VEK76_08015 [Candidatus Binatia bacterium]|nr:hypothetical protein [Candidatus Binatia bacterium]